MPYPHTDVPDLELARIHGWLSGDGRAESRLEKGKHSPHLEVRFFPDNAAIANLFQTNFKNRFGIIPCLYDTRATDGCFTVRFWNVEKCRFILSLGPYGHFGWHVPDFRFPQEKREWARCFFDDEAHVNESSMCIQTKSVNQSGLRQLHNSISDLGVESKIYGPYKQNNPAWSPYSMLVIPGSALETYAEMIGFNHPGKADSLSNLISLRNGND